MELIYDEELEISSDLLNKLKNAGELCLSRENIDSTFIQVSFSIVSPEEIRSYNAQFRNIDEVTDVLSFPQYENTDEILDALNDIEDFNDYGDVTDEAEEIEICIGDVVINDEAVRKQAVEFGHSYERELVYLFTHSILHLLGYDHMKEDEKKEMRLLEESVMDEIGLSADEQLYIELFRKALDISQNAYAPYSHFRVGAVIMTAEGEIFSGVNIENSSYGATICAERSAISSAVTAGYRKFRILAVASPDGEAYPCGICRQVLFEFGGDITVVAGKDEKSIEATAISALLPKGFKL